MRPDGENEYKTKDIGEGAALVTSGRKIIDVRRDGHVCWFVFEHNDQCEEISREYFFGNLKGNLRRYNEAMSVLKNRIFSYLR